MVHLAHVDRAQVLLTMSFLLAGVGCSDGAAPQDTPHDSGISAGDPAPQGDGGAAGRGGAGGTLASGTGGSLPSGTGGTGRGGSSPAGGDAGIGGASGHASGVAGHGGKGGYGQGGRDGGRASGGSLGTGGSDGAAGAVNGQGTCATPAFVTSDPNGGWSDGGYYVHNNMWNDSVPLGPETLYACSYHDWYVVSKQTNDAGAVKTYPNVHKDYDDVPIASFSVITSTFAAKSPHVGIYNVAYDIWTNGVASAGSTEFMIWTENFNQVPAGSRVTTATLGGRTYAVWKTSNNHYIAFVPDAVMTEGSLDLLEIFNWTIRQGWLPSNSTLGQIDFGVEIVSTEGTDATFEFTDFSITDH